MNADDVARLSDAVDQVTDTSDATLWQPKPGDKLIGEVVTRDEVASKFSEHPQAHLVVKTESEDLVHLFVRHVVLQKLITKHDPQPGDRIAIKRLPDTPGKAYRNYAMTVERAADDDIPF